MHFMQLNQLFSYYYNNYNNIIIFQRNYYFIQQECINWSNVLAQFQLDKNTF